MSKALLIIDVQNDYFKGGKSELYQPELALNNIKTVLEKLRIEKSPIIHVQHINTREGASFFLPDTHGVAIHADLAPLADEFLIIKSHPNSFLKTNLHSLVKELELNEFIICGMMSHMCIDTTSRACMDYGIKVTLLHDCCTTKDLVFNGTFLPATTVHNTFMASLNGMFASVISSSELL